MKRIDVYGVTSHCDIMTSFCFSFFTTEKPRVHGAVIFYIFLVIRCNECKLSIFIYKLWKQLIGLKMIIGMSFF